MNELKKTFKHMAFYYLLMAINILPNANIIPDSFPTRNLSAIYLLSLCVCLVLYYAHRVVKSGALSFMMKALSWMVLLLILLRAIKYSAFAEVGVLARHTWYFYYVPMLLLPLLFFYISLLVSPKGAFKLKKRWLWMLALTLVFIGLVLTNDRHQLVFAFKPGFADWDSDYSYGLLFYIISAWQYLLSLAAVIMLLIQCRISSAKKNAWVILIPVSVGTVMISLLLTKKIPTHNGVNIFEFPEALIFTVATVLECCMQLGLIPTNADYGKLFREFSLAAQITDKSGKPVYSSYAAVPLSPEQIALSDGTRISEHAVLHKMAIPGGFGFWQDDLTELDRLNDELLEAKENLAQEVELTRLSNQLKEKQMTIEQRTRVYDAIAARTRNQSQAISLLAVAARQSTDVSQKEKYRGQITLLAAYIKRFANLMLLSEETESIAAGELGLSVSEVLRYLNYYGVPSELFNSADCPIIATAALAVFEAFESLAEKNLSELRGVFVNLSEQPACVVFKLTMEHAALSLAEEVRENLAGVGVSAEEAREDDILYISFTLPKGGAAL